jgi:hypothetical protein
LSLTSLFERLFFEEHFPLINGEVIGAREKANGPKVNHVRFIPFYDH